MIAFEEEVGDEKLWRTVESLLEKARIRAWKAANNYHRLKLQNFFVKNNKNNPAWLNKSAQELVSLAEYISNLLRHLLVQSIQP